MPGRLTPADDKVRKEARHAAGICIRCPNVTPDGKALCLTCRDIQKQHVKDRKAEGVCIKCPAFAEQGKTLCLACATKNVTAHKTRNDTRKASGICRSCIMPRMPDNNLCEVHYFQKISRYHLGSPGRWHVLRDKWVAQEGRCAYTALPMTLGLNAELDHVIPRAAGGHDLPSNLVWCLADVNKMKHKLSLDILAAYCRAFLNVREQAQKATVTP